MGGYIHRVLKDDHPNQKKHVLQNHALHLYKSATLQVTFSSIRELFQGKIAVKQFREDLLLIASCCLSSTLPPFDPEKKQVHFETDTIGTQTNLTTGKVRRIQKLQKGHLS